MLERGLGFCVHKLILYAAVLRAVGIPSRLYYGDVRNHLASPRLRELVGGDVFRFDDVPYDTVVGGIQQAHPLLFASAHTTVSGSLADEAAGEPGETRGETTR